MHSLSELPFYSEDYLETSVRCGYVPQELWDEIFKLLRTRKRALINAALVCKHWRDSVLPYLYAVVAVDASWQPKSFVAFFDFLRQNTTIASCIQDLRLSGPRYEEGICDFDVEQFAVILPMLTSLHTLSINQFALVVPESISRIVADDTRFPIVLRTVKVTGCASTDSTGYLDAFADFFSLFSAETLKVEVLPVLGPVDRDRRESELAAWRPKRLISTRNLVFLFGDRVSYARTQAAVDTHGFFARLLRPGVLTATSSAFNKYYSLMPRQFHDFLRSAPAQSIVSIDLHLVRLSTWYQRAEEWEALGRALSSCTSMRYLRLDLICYLYSQPEGRERSVLCTILSLAPSNIRVLGVRIVTRSWAFLELWDLPQIDDLLDPGRTATFPMLESVIIELDCPRHKALKEAMLPLFPRLRAAGLLKEVFATAPLDQGVFLPAV